MRVWLQTETRPYQPHKKEEADGLVGETRKQSQLSHKADEYIPNENSLQRSLKLLLRSIRERAR
jgi:hypothetical protein